MKKQITHISPVQTAKVLALLYFFMSIPFIAILAVTMLLSPAPNQNLWMLIAFPVLYLVLGFIGTAIGAWAYNLVAGLVGGIEYTSEDS